jgi:hypothetical protein
MKTIAERLAHARAEIEKQQAAWSDAKARLAILGTAPLRVPAGPLAALDAVVRRVHASLGNFTA